MVGKAKAASGEVGDAIIIKKYANRRLYNTESSSYITLDSLAEMVRLGRDFVPSYTNWSRYDPFAYVGVARTANLVSATPQGPIRAAFGSNANTTVRADNALQVLLPAGLGGLAGLSAHHQGTTHPLFQQPNALRHGRRRDVQCASRTLKTAFTNHSDQFSQREIVEHEISFSKAD